MTRILIKNVKSKLDGYIPDEVNQELRSVLSYAVLNAEYSRAYTEGEWDGILRLYNKYSRIFPTGCLSLVIEVLDSFQIPFNIVDMRKRPKIQKRYKLRDGIKPRPYQLVALQRALIYSRGIIQAATGAGKSFIISMIFARLGLPGVVYVNTKDLLYQMVDNLKKYIDGPEENVGIIGDGKVEPSLWTVALVQTVHKALDVKYIRFDDEEAAIKEKPLSDSDKEKVIQTVRKASVVVIDEAQFLGSSTFQTISNNSVNAYYKYGASATPYRTDNADIMLQAATGKEFFSISASELTRMGYLTPAEITMIKMPIARGLRVMRSPTYNQIYRMRISENQVSNKLVTDIAQFFYDRDMTVLILVRDIVHGEILLSMLKSKIQFPVVEEYRESKRHKIKKVREIEFLKGPVVSSKRKKTVELFRERKVKILIATSLADCGLDVPSLDVLIKAGRGKSKVRAPQRVGRVIRTFPGKERAFVFDFIDRANYLRDHAQDRIEIYESEPEWIVRHWILNTKSDIRSYLRRLLASDPRNTSC